MLKYYEYKGKLLFSEIQFANINEISKEEFLKEDLEKRYYLYKMDPKKSKNGFIINSTNDLFSDEEGIDFLFENSKEYIKKFEIGKEIEKMIDEGRVVAINSQYDDYLSFLFREETSKKRVNVLGLGDVGSTLITALKLLGGNILSEIGIYDLSEERVSRWEMELNQVIDPSGRKFPIIKKITFDEIFDCDMFIFTASKYVPAVGSEVKDVRMAQFESNSEIVKIYAKEAIKKNFKGIFSVVSDPVDLLCNVAYFEGLSPNQIKGYGLGVMFGRASYYAAKNNINFESGRAFGPHGKDLIIANDTINYDDDISNKLTKLTVNSNMEIRELGFKPYVAPAISSGVISIINTLEGKWNFSTIFMDGIYFGCKNKLNNGFVEVEKISFDKKLYDRIESTYKELKKFWE